MKLTILNYKGGQGKSLIAHQLITTFGYKGYEFDPYGSLTLRLPDDVTFIEIDAKKIGSKYDDKIIFDFGGFAHQLEEEAISESDLVIIPFVPVLESVQGTLEMLPKIIPHLIKYDIPLLFVPNMAAKEKDEREALNLFRDEFEMEIDYYSIPYLVGLQTAINENVSVSKLAKNGGFSGMPYRKSNKIIQSLHEKILEYDPKNF